VEGNIQGQTLDSKMRLPILEVIDGNRPLGVPMAADGQEYAGSEFLRQLLRVGANDSPQGMVVRKQSPDFKESLADSVFSLRGLFHQAGLFHGKEKTMEVRRGNVKKLAGFPNADFVLFRGKERKKAG
jgi:hypothetical protein